jgi:hypothetical protein
MILNAREGNSRAPLCLLASTRLVWVVWKVTNSVQQTQSPDYYLASIDKFKQHDTITIASKPLHFT